MFAEIGVENGPKRDRQGRDRGEGASRGRGGSRSDRGGMKREGRDKKYGFGGKKKYAKSGDATSAADLRDFSASKMKGRTGVAGAKKRLGKSRRTAGGGGR